MKLSDFRTQIALLSQLQLAQISNISESTIQQIEAGKSFSKLTKGKVLAGLSNYLGRPVDANEIDEFRNH